MRIKSIVTVSAATLAVISATSCSKSPGEQTARRPGTQHSPALTTEDFSSALTNVTDLGVVEISPHKPKRLTAGGGRECVITPTSLRGDILLLEVAVEAKETDGQFTRLAQSQLIATPRGEKCAVSVGDMLIVLTLKLKVE